MILYPYWIWVHKYILISLVIFLGFKYFKCLRIRIHFKSNVFVFEYISKMEYLYSYSWLYNVFVFDYICMYSTPCRDHSAWLINVTRHAKRAITSNFSKLFFFNWFDSRVVPVSITERIFEKFFISFCFIWFSTWRQSLQVFSLTFKTNVCR